MNVPPSLHNARIILRAGFEVLRRHPQLLWFPVLSLLGILALGIACMIAFQGVTEFAPRVGDRPTPSGAGPLAGLVFAIGAQMSLLAGAVALSHAAFEAFAGRPWSVRDALDRAKERRAAIATYAVLAAGVGRALRRRRRGAAGLRTVAHGAWQAATYLVVPVLAREQHSGWDSIARSTKLLQTTWQEAFLGRIVLARLWIPLALALLVPLGLCAWLGIEDPTVLLAAVGLPAVGGSVLAIGLYTLDMIYRTALYVYATEGVVPEPYDHPDLHEIWHARADQADPS